MITSSADRIAMTGFDVSSRIARQLSCRSEAPVSGSSVFVPGATSALYDQQSHGIVGVRIDCNRVQQREKLKELPVSRPASPISPFALLLASYPENSALSSSLPQNARLEVKKLVRG